MNMYATLQQLCNQYGYREIAELLCDEEGLLTQDMLIEAVAGDDLSLYTSAEQAAITAAVERANDAITRQGAYMNSKIGARYQLPLPAGAIADSPLEECCLALTRAYLADDADNSSQMIDGARTRWIKWLTDLAKDQTVIPGATRLGTGGTDNTYRTAKPASAVNFENY